MGGDLNETKFPLYFKFNKIVDAEVLQQLTEIFFKADLNNSELFKNSELKYTNDHKLYIDVSVYNFTRLFYFKI